jgi:hypothetical protein
VPVKIQIANERKQRSERSSENNHQRQWKHRRDNHQHGFKRQHRS